jgi:soluble lytic murein transglycosylase-like protein
MVDIEPRPPAPGWYTRLPLATLYRAASAYQIDPYLLASICQQESGGNPWAMRFEPSLEGEVTKDGSYLRLAMKNGITSITERILQQSSFGLCQILGLTARRMGFDRSLLELTTPAIGLDYGAKLLQSLLKRYNWVEVDAVAAYNAGEVKLNSSGSLVNQLYVTSVCSFAKELRGEG